MSIASELTTLATNKANIKAAIEAMNPATAPTDVLSQWPTAIASIPTGGGGGGGGGSESAPVIFRDYDGTILHSYSAAEAAALTAMPELPTHQGLTCQGWNYTLQQMKTCLSAVGTCQVGATYVTDDGKTRIKLVLQSKDYSTIPIVFSQTVANGVTIDWGDGSTTETVSGTGQKTVSHAYAPSTYPAEYTMTLKVTSGSMSFPTNIMGKTASSSASAPTSAWLNMLQEVYIGSSVTSIGTNAFRYCYSLASITIPSSVTSIGTDAFYICLSLASITIPSSVTSISAEAFNACYSLASITIPSSVANIGTNAFNLCYSLASITIPSSVTSIGTYAFSYCYSLASITIPSSVTSIGTYAFRNCYGISLCDFRAATSVPTLDNVNAFTNTNTNPGKKIVVPDSLYDEWTTATTWSSTTNNIVGSIVKASVYEASL